MLVGGGLGTSENINRENGLDIEILAMPKPGRNARTPRLATLHWQHKAGQHQNRIATPNYNN